MKYGKQFMREIDEFTGLYRLSIINYKKWKKVCKDGRLSVEYLRILEKECNLVNDIFINLCNKFYNRKSYLWIPCSLSSFKLFRKNNHLSYCEALGLIQGVAVNIITLIHYAEFNSRTVTKICKKIDKNTKSNDGRLWLMRMREDKLYKFMGGILLTRLRLDHANQLQECPICMENMGYDDNSLSKLDCTSKRPDVRDSRLLILNCGHGMCVSCVYKFTGIKNNGTIYNLLLTADLKTHCPLCIKKHPFSELSELSFWKKNEK